MGIQGLLPFLKNASRPANVEEFRGKTAAIDVYCWLHKGAFGCADKLVQNQVSRILEQISPVEMSSAFSDLADEWVCGLRHTLCGHVASL